MHIALLRWLFFSVVMGLSPVIAKAFFLFNTDQNIELPLIIGNGELLVFSSAITASAIGELMSAGRSYNGFKLVVGGMTLVMLLLTTTTYTQMSMIKNSRAKGPTSVSSEMIKPNKVSDSSLFLLLFSILTSGACVGVGNIRPNSNTRPVKE